VTVPGLKERAVRVFVTSRTRKTVTVSSSCPALGQCTSRCQALRGSTVEKYLVRRSKPFGFEGSPLLALPRTQGYGASRVGHGHTVTAPALAGSPAGRRRRGVVERGVSLSSWPPHCLLACACACACACAHARVRVRSHHGSAYMYEHKDVSGTSVTQRSTSRRAAPRHGENQTKTLQGGRPNSTRECVRRQVNAEDAMDFHSLKASPFVYVCAEPPAAQRAHSYGRAGKGGSIAPTRSPVFVRVYTDPPGCL
jgi:hypothetical protein